MLKVDIIPFFHFLHVMRGVCAHVQLNLIYHTRISVLHLPINSFCDMSGTIHGYRNVLSMYECSALIENWTECPLATRLLNVCSNKGGISCVCMPQTCVLPCVTISLWRYNIDIFFSLYLNPLTSIAVGALVELPALE